MWESRAKKPDRTEMPERAPETDRDAAPAGGLPHVADERFRLVCEAHLDFVWRFARARGVPSAAAEQVVCKVFGLLQSRLPSLENPEDLRIAIARLTRQVVRSYLHPLASPLELTSEREAAATSGAALDTLAHATDAELVDALLSKLNEPECEVFILCEMEGFSLSETAQALHVGEGTLRARLADACKRFNDLAARLRADRFWVARKGSPA